MFLLSCLSFVHALVDARPGLFSSYPGTDGSLHIVPLSADSCASGNVPPA